VSLGLYFDQHIQGPIAEGLRRQGIDVLTAEADGRKAAQDETLLERATALGRLLVTNDEDFTVIAASWQALGREFAGLVYITEQQIPYGRAIEDLRLIAEGYSAEEMISRIEYLPY
jgi:predicted nuclease of predicted toxin-antitoxin system